MYSLTSRLSLQEVLTRQLPALSASLMLTEGFCKFHSFTLECGAFLLMWYAFDWAGALWRSRS